MYSFNLVGVNRMGWNGWYLERGLSFQKKEYRGVAWIFCSDSENMTHLDIRLKAQRMVSMFCGVLFMLSVERTLESKHFQTPCEEVCGPHTIQAPNLRRYDWKTRAYPNTLNPKPERKKHWGVRQKLLSFEPLPTYLKSCFAYNLRELLLETDSKSTG